MFCAYLLCEHYGQKVYNATVHRSALNKFCISDRAIFFNPWLYAEIKLQYEIWNFLCEKYGICLQDNARHAKEHPFQLLTLLAELIMK